MHVVLISTYELGRQPFGLASPAAWLRQAGATVACQDLSQGRLYEADILEADVVAFYVPMHTATRIAVHVMERVKTLNPRAHLCFYGLYAPMNEAYLRRLGAHTILGGEFEAGLVSLVRRLQAEPTQPTTQPEPVVSLARQQFLVPDRQELPPLQRYAHLVLARTSDASWAIPKPAVAVSTCAGIALSCRSTRVASASCNATSSYRTFASRWQQGLSTSPLAIQTSSMASAMPYRWYRRCTRNFRTSPTT